MAQVGGGTAHVAHTGPRTPLQNERQEHKKDLTSWWRNFKRSDKKPQEVQVPQGIFGVPLTQSIRYANVAISLLNDEGQSYIYGYVPIVVAKCGVFLKEKATETEGIFRLAGSEKRIKELKIAFDSPDRFGKGLDWTGYTVHDAANILRRYFNQLPEPIIPLDFYDRFRQPLRNHQAQAVGSIEAQSPSVGDFDPDAAIRDYQNLITGLPPLNRQLLLYILDLLAVFASKSDLNKMTTPNLAAIFQPGILSHPQHDMAPPEYRLSQDVLIFLIENQDSFLIGMQGTAADAQTVRDVQSGTPTKVPTTPTTPGRSKTIIGRSSSNASTRAESLRKPGDVQRNVSGSSRLSKRSDKGPTPVTPGMSPSASVHRSNTVPSRREGSNSQSPRFSKEKVSDPPTPSAVSPSPVVGPTKPKEESLQPTPVAAVAPTTAAFIEAPPTPLAEEPATVVPESTPAVSRDMESPKKENSPVTPVPAGSAESSAERPAVQTPATSPGRFLDVFKPSPAADSEVRKPNKLQKKPRLPVSSLSSAQSSNQSLQNEGVQDAARSPVSPITPAAAGVAEVVAETRAEPSAAAAPLAASAVVQPTTSDPARNLSAESAQRPTVSPSGSFRSGTDSETDMVGDDVPKDQATKPVGERKRHRWRFSRTHNKLESSPPAAPTTFSTLTPKEQTTSRSTVGSNGPRRSFQEGTPFTAVANDPIPETPMQGQTFSSSSTDPAVFSDSEKEKRGGPMSWFRGKMREHKEKDAEKRARTPDRNRQRSESSQGPTVSNEAIPMRVKSFEKQGAAEAEPSAALATSPSAPTTNTTAFATPATPVVPATVPEAESTDDAAAPPPVVPLPSEHTGVTNQTAE